MKANPHKRPPEGYGRNQAVQNNPHNVRHPEIQHPYLHGQIRYTEEIPLLPNMFSPIQIPVHYIHGHPYYPYLPYLPAYNVGAALEESPYVDNRGSVRSSLFPRGKIH